MKASTSSLVLAAVLALAAAAIAPTARAAEPPARLPIIPDRSNLVGGVVEAQGDPLAGSTVTLYAGSPSGSGVLGASVTDGDGRFAIGYPTVTDGTPVYAIARGPGGAARPHRPTRSPQRTPSRCGLGTTSSSSSSSRPT